jgi:hypothetical protein
MQTSFHPSSNLYTNSLIDPLDYDVKRNRGVFFLNYCTSSDKTNAVSSANVTSAVANQTYCNLRGLGK